MKKLVLFFLFAGMFFAGGFLLAQWLEKKTDRVGEIARLDNGFSPNPFPLQNRAFVVAITGYNNGAGVERTLKSVFSQQYDNFRLIYVDDASDDGSYELARDVIYDSEHLLKVTVVRNESRLGPLANLVRIVESCADDEIVVVLEGEDWLAHEWVLQRLNCYYADPDLWLTFGQSRDFPTFALGSADSFKMDELKKDGFRGHRFVSTHLKTFYAALFKRLQEADFIYQGKVLPAATDLAYMIPMLEMGKEHFQYIPEVLYICNKEARGKEDHELAARCERFVRSLNPYSALNSLPFKTVEDGESLQ